MLWRNENTGRHEMVAVKGSCSQISYDHRPCRASVGYPLRQKLVMTFEPWNEQRTLNSGCKCTNPCQSGSALGNERHPGVDIYRCISICSWENASQADVLASMFAQMSLRYLRPSAASSTVGQGGVHSILTRLVYPDRRRILKYSL